MSCFRISDHVIDTPEDCFFQMSSYARTSGAWVCVITEKKRANSLESITWSELGRQNIQAKNRWGAEVSDS